MMPLAIYWNVDPVAIHIGSWGLRWYSLCFVVAFLLGYWIVDRMFKREKVNDDYIGSLFMYIFLAILIGARLGHCLFYEPGYYLTSAHWFEIVWPFQNGRFTGSEGLASHGAALGILIALLFKYKHNPEQNQ